MIVGIDPNTRYLAVVKLNDAGKIYLGHWILPKVEVKKASPMARLYTIHTEFRKWVVAQKDLNCVYIEDVPFVRNFKVYAQLAFVLSAVVLVCMDADVPVVIVGNTTWKKQVIGSGKADKALIKAWTTRMLGVPEKCVQDVHDAAAIAHYGSMGATK